MYSPPDGHNSLSCAYACSAVGEMVRWGRHSSPCNRWSCPPVSCHPIGAPQQQLRMHNGEMYVSASMICRCLFWTRRNSFMIFFIMDLFLQMKRLGPFSALAALVCLVKAVKASGYLAASVGGFPKCNIVGRSYCKDIDTYPEWVITPLFQVRAPFAKVCTSIYLQNWMRIKEQQCINCICKYFSLGSAFSW